MSIYYPNHYQRDSQPETRTVLLLLAFSLILHVALVIFLPLRQPKARPAELTVEVGALIPVASAASVVRQAVTGPAPQPMATPLRQPAVAPSPVMQAPLRASPAAASLPASYPAAPAGPARGMGRPVPVPFPEQQRRVNTAVPYSSYSSSRRPSVCIDFAAP